MTYIKQPVPAFSSLLLVKVLKRLDGAQRVTAIRRQKHILLRGYQVGPHLHPRFRLHAHHIHQRNQWQQLQQYEESQDVESIFCVQLEVAELRVKGNLEDVEECAAETAGNGSVLD